MDGDAVNVLDEIVAGVREDAAAREALLPLDEVKAAARDARPHRAPAASGAGRVLTLGT